MPRALSTLPVQLSDSQISFCRKKTFFLLICVLGACSSVAGQQSPAMTPPFACTAQGFGHVHHPVRSASPEAQRLFEQALALDYGFNHKQAELCFRQAAELDPKMAMAYWGIALVLGTNYNLPVDGEREKTAYDMVQKALALSEGGPRNERDYIQALAKRYTNSSSPDYDELEAAYHAAMREVHRRYPSDLDAATLFAESGMNLHPWKLYTQDGKPNPGTDEIVAVLQGVLKRDPNHLGANHFYIHAVEASIHPETGLPSARRLAGLAPSSGHLVHMPAHIFIRTGDHEASEMTNVAAARADEAYFAVAHPQSLYPLMYYTHNLHFIAVENAFMGNYARSLDYARRVHLYVEPHLKEMEMLDAFCALPLQIMVRFHRWSDILSEPEPSLDHVFSSGVWHFARSLAFADTGKVEQARSELALLQAQAPAMSKISLSVVGPHNGEVLPQIMMHLMEAHIAAADLQHDQAVAHLRNAVSLEDSLDYNEPPDWIYPMREPLGAALLSAGKPAEAESVFREDLKRNRRNPRSLFGLAESLKAQGKMVEAQTMRIEFEHAWKFSDGELKLSNF